MRGLSLGRARVWLLLSWGAGITAVALALLATVVSSQALAQTGGFDDVPDDAYYSMPVAELSQMGILTGCEEFGGFDVDSFCPGDPIDRKTMAVWVVRILDGQDPPQGGGSRFNDVDCCLPAFWPRFIETHGRAGRNQRLRRRQRVLSKPQHDSSRDGRVLVACIRPARRARSQLL